MQQWQQLNDEYFINEMLLSSGYFIRRFEKIFNKKKKTIAMTRNLRKTSNYADDEKDEEILPAVRTRIVVVGFFLSINFRYLMKERLCSD
jgi:hypothetical protein